MSDDNVPGAQLSTGICTGTVTTGVIITGTSSTGTCVPGSRYQVTGTGTRVRLMVLVPGTR